jgi:DNA-binding MarR family transcriptional regulator
MRTDTRDHIDGIVAQWRRERPDLDVAPLAIIGRLFRATTLADAALAPPLAALGLQSGWSDLLAALRRAGPPYELNPTDLMRAALLSSGGITKRLDRMAEAGLVQRRPDPSDRRSTLVRLTRKGKAVIDRAMKVHLANQERLLQSLSPDERRTLEGLLRTLLRDLEVQHRRVRGPHGDGDATLPRETRTARSGRRAGSRSTTSFGA